MQRTGGYDNAAFGVSVWIVFAAPVRIGNSRVATGNDSESANCR
jgi:hypothetical protein